MIKSKLSKLPVKVLVEVSKRAISNDFDNENPYSSGYEDSIAIIEDAAAWTAVGTIEAIDIEFMAKFISLNHTFISDIISGEKNFNDVSNQFVIPKPKKYLVQYSSKGRGYVIQNYSTDWTSYDKDWVKDSMGDLSSMGEWSFYDGDYLGQDVEDFEEDDLDIDSVEEIPNQTNESILSKLVIENTNDLLEGLDKTSLLQLKKLVENKLKFL